MSWERYLDQESHKSCIWSQTCSTNLSCCRSCFPATSSRSNTYFVAVIQYCDPKLAQFTYIIKCDCKVSFNSFIFFHDVQKVLQNCFPKSKSLLLHSPPLFSVCTLAVTSRVPSTSASPYCFVFLKCAGFHNQSPSTNYVSTQDTSMFITETVDIAIFCNQEYLFFKFQITCLQWHWNKHVC